MARIICSEHGSGLGGYTLCEVLCCSDLSSLELDRLVTIGIAVVQTWRFVHDLATHENSSVMMEAVRSAYRRRARVKLLKQHVFASFSCIGRVRDTFIACDLVCIVSLFVGPQIAR